jgi:hypothetical protein
MESAGVWVVVVVVTVDDVEGVVVVVEMVVGDVSVVVVVLEDDGDVKTVVGDVVCAVEVVVTTHALTTSVHKETRMRAWIFFTIMPPRICRNREDRRLTAHDRQK